MQLNMSELNDYPFDMDDMNNLATSINNLQQDNKNGVLDPENKFLLRKKKVNVSSKEEQFANLGPAPRQSVKPSVSNPIAEHIRKMIEEKKHLLNKPPPVINYQNQNQNQRQSQPIKNNTTTVAPVPTQSRTLTYEDILEKMNVIVKDGNLYYNKNHVKSENNETNSQHVQQRQQTSINSQIPKENNYIYNKYFKQHLQEEKAPVILVPKTKEEYKRMLVDQIINREVERRKIAKIKPKNMLFNNGNSVNLTGGIAVAPNNLFKFNR